MILFDDRNAMRWSAGGDKLILRIARPRTFDSAPAAEIFERSRTTISGQPDSELPATLRRAMEYCAERVGEPISTADIALAARTGVRSLQRAFRTHLETTPLAYLQRIRLDRAHQDLVAIAEGRSEGTVSKVAMRWGFTHLGRFSGQYREVYGRLPVQTMRASTRCG